jgi:ubiquitin-protein ligase
MRSIAPRQVTQIILLALHPFSGESLTEEFLKRYEDQSFRYRTSTIQRLMWFDRSTELVFPFNTVQFGLLNSISKRNKGLLSKFDVKGAIQAGIAKLLGFLYGLEGPFFPQAQLRLILVTDAPFESDDRIAEITVNSEVTIDWLYLKRKVPPKVFRPSQGKQPHSTDVNPMNALKLVHKSGGCAVQIENVETLKHIVESEAFLNITLRHRVSSSNVTFETEFLHQQIANAEIRSKMRAATAVRRPTITGNRTKRILQELEYAAQFGDSDIRVFSTDVIDEWRVFIQGPEGSPYEGVWWYLVVSFPPTYPRRPPSFRYISVPFHVNVSAEGRICLNVLEKEYTSSALVFELLVYIGTLFECPNYEDPIDADRKALAAMNKQEFFVRAKKSCAQAHKSITEWLAILNAT